MTRKNNEKSSRDATPHHSNNRMKLTVTVTETTPTTMMNTVIGFQKAKNNNEISS